MKSLFCYTILLVILLPVQDKKIIGRFNMKFEKQFEYQNGVIDFHDSIYTRLLLNGKAVKGKIRKNKSDIILSDNDSDFEMFFPVKKWGKDTLYFATSTKGAKMEDGEMIIYSGKLMKVMK